MIDYSPFWETLERSDENWYTLTNKHHMSHSTLHRLKHNKDVSTKTLNDLCRILNCNICDLVQYIPSDTDQPLELSRSFKHLFSKRVKAHFLICFRQIILCPRFENELLFFIPIYTDCNVNLSVYYYDNFL